MILVLHEKHGDYPVYARNPAEKERAWLHLFTRLDEDGCYQGRGLNDDQLTWYTAAKAGDAAAAQRLLENRWEYEYEEIERFYPVTP